MNSCAKLWEKIYKFYEWPSKALSPVSDKDFKGRGKSKVRKGGRMKGPSEPLIKTGKNCREKP
jgi:hypothetical protein